MPTKNGTQLNTLMNQIEEMWDHLETLFNSLNGSGGWNQPHGADWTLADVPYHLAYCNRDLVGRAIELGPDLPGEEQELITSMEGLSAWNARKFAERPASQTVQQSLEQWSDSCDYLRRLTAEMDDTDLDRPFWMPLFMGWTKAEVGLNFCRTHDWSEFTQLRVHMGRAEPVPSPAITRGFLGDILNYMPMFLNQEVAADRQFTTVMAFTDPGVEAWTIRVDDGAATVSEGETAQADLIITQSAETFEKTRQGIQDPAEAMQSGQIQVSNFDNLAIFGQLFPM
jgi:hypothetical protein